MPPEEVTQLKSRIELLEKVLGTVLVSDKVLFKRHIELLNGRDIKIGTGTGTKIGTATGQKLGFYNATPIVQPSGANQAVVSGTADSTYSANEVTLINAIVTLLNQIRSDLVSVGIIKGSA